MFSRAIMITTNSSIATIPASTSSGSERRVSKTLTILSDSDVLAQEIVDDLEAALEPFREIAADLGVNGGKSGEL
jgi:hypothetical protein